MKAVITGAVGIVTAMPGVGAILSGAISPKAEATFFGIVTSLASVVALLLVLGRADRIRAWPDSRASRRYRIAGIAGVALIVGYWPLYDHCVIEASVAGGVEEYYLPVVARGDLADMIERSGSRDDIVDDYGNSAVIDAIEAQPVWLTAGTDLLLAFMLSAFNVSAVTLLATLATRAQGRESGNPKAQPSDD